jgi:sRNA-binding protein
MCCRAALMRVLLAGLFLSGVAGAAEPNYTIRLLSGSELKADNAWVQGDYLVYQRYGSTGSVRMVDVAGLIDRELEEKAAHCRANLADAKARVNVINKSARDLREQSPSAGERGEITRAEGALTKKAMETALRECGPALEKLDRNSRMFDEAREKARR